MTMELGQIQRETVPQSHCGSFRLTHVCELNSLARYMYLVQKLNPINSSIELQLVANLDGEASER